MNPTSYWPFFLTGFFPCVLALIGILINKHDFAVLREDLSDIKGQMRYLIDLHINHEGRLATVEERTKKP